MIGKDRIFKRGDVVVSGFGNIRIFTGDKYGGDAYKCLACYCTSDAPAGTDMRYARHATEKEKNRFFSALKANGLCLDKKTLEVSIVENKPVENLKRAYVDWKADGPLAYKVVKKRVRPTLKEVNELRSGLENEQKLHLHFAKECDRLKNDVMLYEKKIEFLDELVNTVVKEKGELNNHLEDVKACNEKYAKEINRLEDDNKALRENNATLEQSNKLMEEELDRLRSAVNSLNELNDDHLLEIERLKSRGFWSRIFGM